MRIEKQCKSEWNYMDCMYKQRMKDGNFGNELETGPANMSEKVHFPVVQGEVE